MSGQEITIEVLFNLVQAKLLRRGTFPPKQALVQKLLEKIDGSSLHKEGYAFQWSKLAEAELPGRKTGHS